MTTRRFLLIVFILTLGLSMAAAELLLAQGRGGRGGGRGGRGGWGAGRGGANPGGWGRGGRNNPNRPNRNRGDGEGEDGEDGLTGWIDWIDGSVEDNAQAEATGDEEESSSGGATGGNPMAGFSSRRNKRDTDGNVIRQAEDAIDAQGKKIIVIYVYQASAEARDQRATEACKEFEDTVLADERVADLINKGVAIRVHIDDVDRDVDKLYGLRSAVPQIVILDPTGKKLWVGTAPSVDKLIKYLEAAHEKVAEEFGTDEDEGDDGEDADSDEEGDEGDDEPSSNDDADDED